MGLHTHPLHFVSSSPFFYSRGQQFQRKSPKFQFNISEINQTIIKDDVWIGSNSIILGGITLEQGTVIGAGAVITKNTEPYGIYVGNPARLLRKRFSDKQICKLLKLDIYKSPARLVTIADSMLDLNELENNL